MKTTEQTLPSRFSDQINEAIETLSPVKPMKTFQSIAARSEHNRANTCFQSIDETPVTLPAVGTRGDYVMPAIVTSDGVQHAPGFRIPCTVALHIGKFGLQLTEDARPRFAIECHFSSFEPYAS